MNKYFSDEEVVPYLYQWIEEDDPNKKSSIWQTYLHKPIEKVIKGTIFTQKQAIYYLGYEECMSVSWDALLSALPKFNPEYGKEGRALFNYISLVVKRATYFAQIKDYKRKIDLVELTKNNDPGYEDGEDMDRLFYSYMDWLLYWLPVKMAGNKNSTLIKAMYYLKKYKSLGYKEASTITPRLLHSRVGAGAKGAMDQHVIRIIQPYLHEGYEYFIHGKPFPSPPNIKHIIYDIDDKRVYTTSESMRHDLCITKSSIETFPIREEKIWYGKKLIRFK